MRELRFKIPGVPVAQPRQRHAARRIGNKTIVTNYTAKSDPVNAFKATAKLVSSQANKGSQPIAGPVAVEVDFVFPRPLAMVWKTKPMPRVRHWKKPDADNLLKSLFDAINSIVWHDDAQVSETTARKWIASGDEQPAVYVTVRELEIES